MSTFWKYLEKNLGRTLLLHLLGLYICLAWVYFTYTVPVDASFYVVKDVSMMIVPWVFWYCGIVTIFISTADILYANDKTVKKEEREQNMNAGIAGLVLTVPLLFFALFIQLFSSIFILP